jgi:hypothetical protein
MRNHFDIISLHKTDRLKHYGLHFAKYSGRVARENLEEKPLARTMIDTLLVCLSAANTMHQDLSSCEFLENIDNQVDPLRPLADAAGRFADACEKIDHLEEFIPIAKRANVDIFSWVLDGARRNAIELSEAVSVRRRELAARHFYIPE